MILDSQLQFSDAQAITATAASTNYIDFGAIRDMANGKPLYVVLVVDVAFTDSGSDSTVAVTIETDDNTSFSSATTGQALFTLAALSAAGTKKYATISVDELNERYARLKYTLANGNLSTGSVTAFLTDHIDKWVGYADNVTIS